MFWPGRARACTPFAASLHTIDPAQVGVDQTPPRLAKPVVADLQDFDTGSSGCPAKCGSDHGATLTNLATDDMTPAEKIGYRVTLVAGAAQYLSTNAGNAADGAADGTFRVFWDGGDDFDFTIQLVAVDAAGNESAPQTVRIYRDDGLCSVGGRQRNDRLALVVVALALATAAARPRRRRR